MFFLLPDTSAGWYLPKLSCPPHRGWMPPALGLFLFLIRSAGRLSIVHVDMAAPRRKNNISVTPGLGECGHAVLAVGDTALLLSYTWLLAFWQIAPPSLRLEISVIRRRIISCRSPNALPYLPTPHHNFCGEKTSGPIFKFWFTRWLHLSTLINQTNRFSWSTSHTIFEVTTIYFSAYFNSKPTALWVCVVWVDGLGCCRPEDPIPSVSVASHKLNSGGGRPATSMSLSTNQLVDISVADWQDWIPTSDSEDTFLIEGSSVHTVDKLTNWRLVVRGTVCCLVPVSLDKKVGVVWVGCLPTVEQWLVDRTVRQELAKHCNIVSHHTAHTSIFSIPVLQFFTKGKL